MVDLFLIDAVRYGNGYMLLLLAIGGFLIWEWRSYQKLASFKGPFMAKFSNLWICYTTNTKKQYLDRYILTFSVNSARSGYKRSTWYLGNRFQPDRDHVFSIIDDEAHQKRRAQVAIGYSGKEIDGLEELVDKHVQKLIELITKRYISSESYLCPMDLARKASFFTLDVITDIAFGSTWGCISQDADVDGWFEATDQYMEVAFWVGSFPVVNRLLRIPFIAKAMLPSDKDRTGAGRLIGMIKSAMEKHVQTEGHETKKDMMGSFFRRGISASVAVSEASLATIAGSDTTATAIRATMLFAITNPHVYRKLQAEIDSVPRKETIISEEQAKNLPYLQATIKEGVRIWPPTTSLTSKVTPQEGDTINGVFIPGGTEIGVCVWGVQRDKKIYGDDSMLFNPDRWLRASGEELESMERSLALVWGHGKNQCLGKSIALLELNKVFFELFKNFDFTLIDPSMPWNSNNIGLWLQKEMFVKVTARA
ncbi:Cytochrome P450 monooxygenase tropD [Lachnellula suecica]|uniref:Cytochrome P450 monooxygenase tropD n=1 Tax=Lachnellula suecica TaxID=602035 RepID=A0A8T9CB90_9HELO|nr:Cytochrome P450 monooxygenase tropD [Lachnellula suecica]